MQYGNWPVNHEFEEDDTGDELELNPDLTYEIVQSFVDIEDGTLVFTHRVKLARYQFAADKEQGVVHVIDTELGDVPGPGDDGEGGPD